MVQEFSLLCTQPLEEWRKPEALLWAVPKSWSIASGEIFSLPKPLVTGFSAERSWGPAGISPQVQASWPGSVLVLAQNGINIGPLRGLLDNEQRKNAYLLSHLPHTISSFSFCVILSAPTPLCPCLLPSFLLLCLSFSFATVSGHPRWGWFSSAASS